MSVAIVIDGKQAAASVIETVARAAEALERETHVKAGLAVVIVGDDPASHAYVASKSRMAKQCGFNSIQHSMPEETTQEGLQRLVARSEEPTSELQSLMRISYAVFCLQKNK